MSIEENLIKECVKLKANNKNIKILNETEKEAIIFLKLRNEGCPRKAAISFTSRKICLTDSTKLTDGPPNFRILKIKK